MRKSRKPERQAMTTTMVKREPATEELLPGGASAKDENGGEAWILAGLAGGLLIVLVPFVLTLGTRFSRSILQVWG
jgi:hypothetical protein